MNTDIVQNLGVKLMFERFEGGMTVAELFEAGLALIAGWYLTRISAWFEQLGLSVL